VRLPKWLFVQKFSLILYFACAVFLLIYALGFISNVYIFYAYGNKSLVDFYDAMQIVNKNFLWKAVLAIVFSVVFFILGLGKYPAGRFTLIITIIICGFSIFFCVNSFISLANSITHYTSLDFSSLNRYIERGAISYNKTTLPYLLGFAGYTLFLLASFFVLITVIKNAVTVQVLVLDTEGKK